jgi:hypothetical protein
MRGVITRVDVLAHPIVIAESFGLKVLVRAMLASPRETFLEIVRRCAEEEAHAAMHDVDLARTVTRFIDFEIRVGEIYRRVAAQLADAPEAAQFFAVLSVHEEGHAVVLSRVKREIRRGHLWKQSKQLHHAAVAAFEARLAAHEAEVRRGVTLPRALEIVEAIEGSELNVVFDALNGCVDMRSRARFERFFVLTQRHLSYIGEQLRVLRAQHDIVLASA